MSRKEATALLTPAGTQYPSIVAPGDVLGNPCEPGGKRRKPSLMTAWRYGSWRAEVDSMSSYRANRERISDLSFEAEEGDLQRK